MEPKMIIAIGLAAFIVLYGFFLYCLYKYLQSEKREQDQFDNELQDLCQFYHDETI